MDNHKTPPFPKGTASQSEAGDFHDITIVGGGLVGTTLAIALANSPWRIALIETFLPTQHQQAKEDMRSLALSAASQHIFESLNLWQDILSYTTAIQKIHVSEEKRFGKTVLDAKVLKLPPLGYVTPIPFVYQVLQNHLAKHSEKITVYCPETVKNISKQAHHWQLALTNNKHIQTSIVIAADGDNSFIRKSLDLPIQKTDYSQTAIVTSALVSKPHYHTAYERFTSQGVLAVLPLQDKRVAVIWTVPNNYLEKIRKNLLEETQSAMGYRLGKFSDLGNIQCYSLKSIHAHTQTLPGVFLLGNAAHVLHPIAAQGLNLSLRDAKILAELFREASNLTDPVLSETYLKLRQSDQQDAEKFTENLVKLFTPQFLPLSILRSMGLGLLDCLPFLKRRFCLKRMGFLKS